MPNRFFWIPAILATASVAQAESGFSLSVADVQIARQDGVVIHLLEATFDGDGHLQGSKVRFKAHAHANDVTGTAQGLSQAGHHAPLQLHGVTAWTTQWRVHMPTAEFKPGDQRLSAHDGVTASSRDLELSGEKLVVDLPTGKVQLSGNVSGKARRP